MWAIDTARAHDRDFIRDSWRKSYRESPRTGRWPHEAYAVWIGPEMERLLERSRVLVARPPDWDEGVIGWLVAEQHADRLIVHYAFTKDLFRRQGICRALLAAMEPRGELVMSTLRPPFSDALKRLGCVFDRAASQPG